MLEADFESGIKNIKKNAHVSGKVTAYMDWDRSVNVWAIIGETFPDGYFDYVRF
jgi:hypothetical protein